MNSIQTQPPETKPAQGESEPFDIFLRVRVPESFYILGNALLEIAQIPANLLGEALTLKLASHGIDAKGNCVGTLHLLIGIFKVADVGVALPHIKDLLFRVTLSPFTSIFYYDHRERMFRTVQLGITDQDSPYFTMEQIIADYEKLKSEMLKSNERTVAMFERWREIAQAFPPSNEPPSQP